MAPLDMLSQDIFVPAPCADLRPVVAAPAVAPPAPLPAAMAPDALGADALLELGLKYCTGREVGLDLVAAHKWFNLAAMRGSDDARRLRAEITRDMTKAEVVRGQRLAREWLNRH